MSDVNSQDLSQEILASPAKASIFLTVTIRSGGEAQVIDLLTGVSGLTRAVGFRYPETMLSCVVGIGAGMWDRLFDVPRPEYLHDFTELQGGKHSAPSTPGDLFFHLRASTLDMCFELVRQIMRTPFATWTIETLWASSTVPRVRGGKRLSQRRSSTKVLGRAAATSLSRSTSTTSPPGTR